MGTLDLTKATPKYLIGIVVLLSYSSKIYTEVNNNNNNNQ